MSAPTTSAKPIVPADRRPSSPWTDFIRRPGVFHALVIWLIVILAIPASRLASSSFPSVNQIQNVVVLASFLGVAAFGEGLVILSGGFDLSVSSVITAAGVLVAAYVQNDGSTVVGVVLALLAAAGIGAATGIGVAYFRVPPFIMTIATGSIVAGALQGLNESHPSRPSPSALHTLFGTGRSSGLPDVIWFFIAFVILAVILQHVSKHGRRVYAVGNSERVAEMSGLPVRAVTASVYAIAGLCYGLAGIMLTGYSSGADLTLGNDYLLPAIAAVVVGGVSIKGGRGTYLGVVGGVLLLTTVGNDIDATSLAQGWKQVLYGAIVAGALILSVRGRDGLRRISPHRWLTRRDANGSLHQRRE